MTVRRFMTAILCDDVRREEGNKLSYLGIYGSTLLVPDFPIAIPKLCVIMSVACPAGEAPPKSLAFRLFSDDQLMSEVVIPPEKLRAIDVEGVVDRESRRLIYSSVLQIFPLQFSQPCTLKARAQCDEEELKGGSWKVERSAHGSA